MWTSVFGEALSPFIESRQRRTCGGEAIEREVQRQSVIDREQRVTHFAPGPALLEEIPRRIKIAERLRHLLPLDHQVRAVQPVAHEFPSRAAFALRDLRLVVRKDVVYATAMNIQLRTEQRRRHRAALDVPARSPRSPRRIPFHVTIALVPGLPEREVSDRFFFVFIIRDASARPQFLEIQMRQLSVIRKLREPE